MRLPPVADDIPAGRIVLVDQGHHNLGSLDNIFSGWLAEHDYQLRTVSGPFDEVVLAGAHVLLIRNPVHAENVDNFVRPIRSAFSQAEIRAVVRWVEDGGGLFLIIEHMPWAGAMSELASAFGATTTNGFVIKGGALSQVMPTYIDSAAGAFVFRRADGGLLSHPVTRGVDSVFTNWGTAFRLPHAGTSLLTLDSAALSLEPEVAWKFPNSTPVISVGGWSQGALLSYGRGRVVLLGDSFLVFAPGHIREGTPTEAASQHPQFTLNLLRWVSGNLP